MRTRLKKYLVGFAATIVSVTGLAACDSPAGPRAVGGRPAFDEAAAPEAVDGRLVFRDGEHLTAYLEPLSEASTAEIVKVEQALPRFESLRAYLDPNEWTEETARAGADNEELDGSAAKAAEADGVSRSDFPLGDPILSVINSRGEVQIGDRVFKLTRDNAFEVSPGDLGLLREQVPTLSSPAPAPDGRIVVHPVETTGEFEDGAAVKTRSGAPRSPRYNVVEITSGSNRLRCSSYITNAFFYAEAGVNTTWQRKRKFLWITYWTNAWQSGTLAHNYTSALLGGSLTVPLAPVGPPSGSQSVTGTERIHKTLAWFAGFGVVIRGKVNTTHSVNNSSMNATCTTSASF